VTTSRILIALSETELREFFPEDVAAGRTPGGLDAKVVTTRLDPAAWSALLREMQPEVVIGAWSTPRLPDDLVDAMPLKYLCYCCGSVRSKLARSWIERGLLVSNWGSLVAPIVAECALMLIIAGLRGVGPWQLAMHRDGGWKATGGTRSIYGKRIGIHGLGAIARALVRLLQPFGVTVTSYDPPVPDALFAECGVRRAQSLAELFSGSDVLVELAAATPENRGIVDAHILGLLPEGALFVNTGRAMVVDEAELARLAHAGRVHLALDVYQHEPLPVDSPLRGAPNTLLLPHIAGPTTDQRPQFGAYAVANAQRYFAGERPEALITPEMYDRAT
jgi:phosphoglycerate dehydrogenase-like enzyme